MRDLSRLFACLLVAAQPAAGWAQHVVVAPVAGAPGGALGLPAVAAGSALPGGIGSPASPGVQLPGGPGLQAAQTVNPAALGPAAAPTYGELTGALGRAQTDPGPVKRMWVVYRAAEDLANIAQSLAKVKAANPGVEVVSYREDAVLPRTTEKGKPYDNSAPARRELFDRLLKEGAEFVLATDQSLYEQFRGLRDSNLARQIPMGFAGRKFVSVDMPRSSLDPAALSDPAQYPAQRYLVLGAPNGAPARALAGMEGIRKSLEGAVAAGAPEAHAYEFPKVVRLAMLAMMKLSGQADPRRVAALRKQAHRLAGYLDQEKIDVVATDDPKAAEVLGLMKRMGYHKSVPVVWTGKAEPLDAAAINVALSPAAWQAAAPHVAVSPQADLDGALAFAKGIERLPENFMEMGGVSVRGFEAAVARALESAVGGGAPGLGRFDVHFLMTNGNGVDLKGDANPFGHFGMAVTDEKGKAQVWTVQYNDGGSFTGGLGEGKQLTLPEYLYSLWYLPGAVGQAIPLAETAVSPVYDFILRGVDEAQVEEMRRKAAEINARHLRGKDGYEFFNQGGNTNCISLVTQILRAAGFRVPETGVQDPAGQAFNMVHELSRWLLNGRLSAADFGLVVFERAAQAGPAHYRIANTALASPMFSRHKPWQKMRLWEKAARVLMLPWHMAQALRVPSYLERFARFASHRVVVGPNTRQAEVVENAESPILKMRGSAATIARLRRERVPLMESLGAVEDRVIKLLGFDGWQTNPAQSIEEREKDGKLDLEARTRLEADLAEHSRLSVALGLNRIDEQVELRRIDFLTIQLVDPAGRRWRRLDRLREDYARVLAYRNALLKQNRLLGPAEIDDLDALNSRIETSLESMRLKLLKDAGPAVPQSIKMILGQIDRETLEDLRELGQGGGAGKPKPKT